jgi:signal transduction histidine kinase
VTERSLWLRERRPRSPYLLDGLIGAGIGSLVLTAFVLVKRTPEFDREADAAGVLLVVLAWGSLVFRRRAPVAVFAATAVVSTIMPIVGYPDTGITFSALIALYTIASRRGRGTTAVALVVAIVCAAVSTLLSDPTAPLAAALAGVAMSCGAAAWGDRKQVREAYVEQLELRAAEKERERIEAAERAVGAERARIARELHDVVAHAMSVVAVQSGVGAHVIDAQPEAAKRILETISDTSRDALSEMRRLLGVLRSAPGAGARVGVGGGDGDDDRSGDLAPAPGLAALDELAARVADAGVPVDLRVEGPRGPLPAGVDLAAYRIVQEALTNVLKHAGPARATVTVRYSDDAVRLVVSDDGRGATVAGVTGNGTGSGSGRPGHGILGMRERAELYGGSLAAGPGPGGGFRVTATLHHDGHAGAGAGGASSPVRTWAT